MPDESNELSGLSESHRQEALKRFYLIRPHLEEGVAIPKISEGSSFSVRTLRRWVKRYSENGLLGLARTRKSPPEPEVTIETIIEGVYLASPDISISNLKRRVDDIAPDMNLKTVSYSSVYRIVKAIDPRLISLAHDGRKAYSEKFDLVHRRECSKPNEIWQADHTQLDILVYNEKGKVVRPWLTIILDDYSRAICGYSINTESPCALNTALVLHDSIWRKHEPNWHVCGIPDKFYTDHGSDFTSRHMEQVAADLRMQLIFSTKGNPRGRGKLERFFGTVNQLFLSNLPGYISRRCKSEPSISLKTLEEKFKSWLLKEYLVSIHDEIGMAPLGK